jgi:acetate CoA/acetoacetate CoA-transferase beta subunit
MTVDGCDYLLELPLRADLALLKAHRADPFGNLVHQRAARNFNPVIAMAADCVHVEVDELYSEPLEPDIVVTRACWSIISSWPRGRSNMQARERIAQRVAQELKDGDVVNLGIGLPTLVPAFLPPEVRLVLQSENGFVGLGSLEGKAEPGAVDAGGRPCGLQPGAAMFDSAMSYCLIRGGHVDVTVLGGLQVDRQGNLANWMVPGKMVPGMGGAMDLLTGARRVIVAMEHCTRDGQPRLLEQCTLPLTACGCVSMVVTELAVFTIENGHLQTQELCRVSISSSCVRLQVPTSFHRDWHPIAAFLCKGSRFIEITHECHEATPVYLSSRAFNNGLHAGRAPAGARP